MKTRAALVPRDLVYVIVLCLVVKDVGGGSKETMAVADRYMENTVIRTGSLYSEHVASPGQCCIVCLATNSCVSFYYNSIPWECLPHSTIHQPSDTSVTELNWKYFFTFETSGGIFKVTDIKYYFPPYFVRKWDEVKAFYESIGAYIVQIETQEEQTWLSSQRTYMYMAYSSGDETVKRTSRFRVKVEKMLTAQCQEVPIIGLIFHTVLALVKPPYKWKFLYWGC